MRRGILLSFFVVVGCSGADFKIPDASDDGTTGDGSKESGASDAANDNNVSMDGASCNGSHPIVDGGARYCNPGDCYCMPNDKCLPMGIAQSCCTVMVKCN